MIKKIYVNENNIPDIEPNVSCIGYFDGVHIGHQALISKTVKLAKKLKVEPYLITFYPDPSDIVFKSKTNHINTFNRRIKLFEQFGIKGVIIVEFNEKVMAESKDVFAKKYLANFNLKALVCGYDFHYGYKGEGDHKTLKDDLNKEVPIYMVRQVKYYGKKVSSTRIKEELKKSNMNLVNKLLGYKYE